MKATRLVLTIVLLLFVGATVGTLIAQEAVRAAAEIADGGELSPPAGASIATASSEAADDTTVATSGATSPSEPEGSSPVGTTVEKAATGAEEPASSGVEATEDAACTVDAIYFHNTSRCWTCQKIESDARAIVESEFAEEVASGRLRWSAINMEDQRQYVLRYDLTKPTLILVRSVGGEPEEWIALDETWNLIRSAARFSTYIVSSFRAFLEGCS